MDPRIRIRTNYGLLIIFLWKRAGVRYQDTYTLRTFYASEETLRCAIFRINLSKNPCIWRLIEKALICCNRLADLYSLYTEPDPELPTKFGHTDAAFSENMWNRLSFWFWSVALTGNHKCVVWTTCYLHNLMLAKFSFFCRKITCSRWETWGWSKSPLVQSQTVVNAPHLWQPRWFPSFYLNVCNCPMLQNCRSSYTVPYKTLFRLSRSEIAWAWLIVSYSS